MAFSAHSKKILSFSAHSKKMADEFNHFILNILSCIVLGVVIAFQEFSSSFSRIFQAIIFVFSTTSEYYDVETSSKVKNTCGHDIVNNEAPLDEDVEIVLDTLMSFCNSIGDKNIDRAELAKVLDSFDEAKPSLEEIREVFSMFDENGDGYIDANELKKVICKFGFFEFSVEDCKRMIMTYDDNRDGKIDFCELVKFMEQSTFF